MNLLLGTSRIVCPQEFSVAKLMSLFDPLVVTKHYAWSHFQLNVPELVLDFFVRYSPLVLAYALHASEPHRAVVVVVFLLVCVVVAY